MKPSEFVSLAAKEKAAMLAAYMDANSGALVSAKITELDLNATQKIKMKSVLDCALSDAFYTFILALDGSASLGGDQRLYDLKDDHGNQLSGNLESVAWDLFQASKE